jgi:transposase
MGAQVPATTGEAKVVIGFGVRAGVDPPAPAPFAPRDHHYSATGLAPAMYESATIRRRGRISRQGPAVHRDALIGIAWGEVDALDAVRAAIHLRILGGMALPGWSTCPATVPSRGSTR